MAIDRRGGWHRREELALIGSVTVAQLGGEIHALHGDVFLVLLLAVECDDVLDRAEVAVLLGVFGLMKSELVFGGGGRGGSSRGAGTLEAFLTLPRAYFSQYS